MPESPRPARRLPTEDRRRQIADAALRIIAEQGLRRFTTAAIAKAVGVTDGSLFRHFASKEEIIDAAIARVEDLLLGEPPPEQGDPLERLGEFFRRRVRAVRGHRGVGRIVFSEQLEQAAGPAGARRVAQLRRRSFEYMRRCLEEASRAGLVDPDASVDDLALLVNGAALALVFQPSPAGAASEERVWASLERLLRRSAARP